MEQTLQASHLVKRYGKKEVLHDVSLTIEPGVIYGLIGRNGAGKTTLLSILTAQNTHDAGTVTYGGQPVWENEKALADLCFSRELSGQILSGQNTSSTRNVNMFWRPTRSARPTGEGCLSIFSRTSAIFRWSRCRSSQSVSSSQKSF